MNGLIIWDLSLKSRESVGGSFVRSIVMINNIKMNLREVECGGVSYIELSEDIIQKLTCEHSDKLSSYIIAKNYLWNVVTVEHSVPWSYLLL